MERKKALLQLLDMEPSLLLAFLVLDNHACLFFPQKHQMPFDNSFCPLKKEKKKRVEINEWTLSCSHSFLSYNSSVFISFGY